jgi:hypothetical protein
MRQSILENNVDGEPSILDWESLCFEVKYFYQTNREIFDALTGGEELSVDETAEEVFYALIFDYALSKAPKHQNQNIKLSYQLAEA